MSTPATSVSPLTNFPEGRHTNSNQRSSPDPAVRRHAVVDASYDREQFASSDPGPLTSQVKFSPASVSLYARDSDHAAIGKFGGACGTGLELGVADAGGIATGALSAANAAVDGVAATSKRLEAVARQVDEGLGSVAAELGHRAEAAIGYGVLAALAGVSMLREIV